MFWNPLCEVFIANVYSRADLDFLPLEYFDFYSTVSKNVDLEAEKTRALLHIKDRAVKYSPINFQEYSKFARAKHWKESSHLGSNQRTSSQNQDSTLSWGLTSHLFQTYKPHIHFTSKCESYEWNSWWYSRQLWIKSKISLWDLSPRLISWYCCVDIIFRTFYIFVLDYINSQETIILATKSCILPYN